MKRLLLAAAAAIPLLTGQAHAQGMPVYDNASNLTRIAEAGRAIQQAIQEYRVMESTYNSISHATGVGGIASALGGVSRSFMPQAGNIPGLMNGRGGMFGSAGQRLEQDRFYAPAEADVWSEEMERRETVTANAKALAEAGLEDTQERIEQLEAAQAEIEAQEDGTANTATGNLIAASQMNLNAHRLQLDQIRTMLAADDRVTAQRQEQKVRKDLDDWREEIGNDTYGNW
jgi:hypothetical protein